MDESIDRAATGPVPPAVELGHSGHRWWRVGGDRIELKPEGSGYTARV